MGSKPTTLDGHLPLDRIEPAPHAAVVRVTGRPAFTSACPSRHYGAAMDIPGRGPRTCLALALAGVLAACAGDSPAATQAQAATVYASIVSRVYGTPAQRQAADERAWHITQTTADECRSRAGLRYPATGYTPPSEREHVAPGALLGFAPARADFDIAEQLNRLVQTTVNAEHHARWMARTGRGSGVAWQAAQRCAATAATAIPQAVPNGQEQLDAALVAELARVQATAAPTLPADYRDCLQANRLDAADLPSLQARVEQAFPAVPLGARTVPARLPGWKHAVAFEQRAAAVDARCRAHAVDVVLTAALPVLTTFAATHAEALNEVAAGWARIEVEARELRPKD
jgi:hypothetical protein